jgi:TolB-like protein
MPYRTLAVVILFAALAAAPPASCGNVIVLLPFENLSATDAASSDLAVRFSRVLEEKGWTVADRETTEEVLREHRARYLDSLDDETRAALLERTRASAYVAGTVYAYEGDRNPAVSLSLRMVRADGTTAWNDVAALTAADTERWFGFGRAATAAEVAGAAMTKLRASVPSPSEDTRWTRGLARPLLRTRPSTYRAPDLDPSVPHLVCVLPFENLSQTTDATRIVSDVLLLRLASAAGFEVVDPAKLRAAALRAHIFTFRDAPNDALARLAPQIGTTLFLRGSIYEYVESGGGSEPSLELELSLIDVSSGRVLWSAQHERTGSDYSGLLLLGTPSNAVLLTDRVITEMIDAEAEQSSARDSERLAARRDKRRLAAKHSLLRSPKDVK